MSGRHQCTTWRALDLGRLGALRRARGDVKRLTEQLAQVPRDPDENAAHCESVWERPGLPDIVRPDLLRRFLRADPPRWAPLLAEALVSSEGEEGAPFLEQTLREVASELALELVVPDAYGVLLHVSTAYALRFGVTATFPDAEALRDAFGGEPDPSEPDLRSALRDALYPPEKVRWIAEHLEVPATLPALVWTLPHPVERFELTASHLHDVIAEVASFYRGVADAELAAQVSWHPNP